MSDKNLESLNDLQKQIKIGGLFSCFLPEKSRMKFEEINANLSELTSIVDSFNVLFSDYGWCAYDDMSYTVMKSAIEVIKTDGIDSAEKVLINYYKSDEIKRRILWLRNKSDELKIRYEMIQKAFDDHFAERYYASVPLFLIIIDGAVNDFTKNKGFFAEGTDVTAWDCLVGCDNGLSKLKAIFYKPRKKTNVDKILFPYRNGILHGRDLNYGNEVVSCKCVSLLFAVANWMKFKENEEERKEKFKKEHELPSITEIVNSYEQRKQIHKELDDWQAKIVVVGKDVEAVPTDKNCIDFKYLEPIVHTFKFWQTCNYGSLAILLRHMFYEKTDKKRAGEAKKLFSNKKFIEYEIKEIEERAAAMTRVLVRVKWETNEKLFDELLEFGCCYENDKKEDVALPWRNNGNWVIYPWKVQGLYKN